MPVNNNNAYAANYLKRFTLALVNSIDMLGVLSVRRCLLFAGSIVQLSIVYAYVSFYVQDFYHIAPFFLILSISLSFSFSLTILWINVTMIRQKYISPATIA